MPKPSTKLRLALKHERSDNTMTGTSMIASGLEQVGGSVRCNSDRRDIAPSYGEMTKENLKSDVLQSDRSGLVNIRRLLQ